MELIILALVLMALGILTLVKVTSVAMKLVKGAFTQSVLCGVIRRRLGYLINKKYFFH